LKRDKKYFDKDKFKSLRLQKGISQMEMSEICETYQCEISAIESGRRAYPGLGVIVEAVKYFDCKLEDLILIP
jgi:transcriptional regulator with XRE-family HTH domain